jgi:SAM-dependent methyltransferase
MHGRSVVPELLDSLPAHDPDALRSRSDLVRINALMGSHRWFAARIATLPPGARVLEIGPGDGHLTSRIAPQILASGGSYTAVDLQPAPPSLAPGVRWIRDDLRNPAHWRAVDVLVANLVLHHFDDTTLRGLRPLLAGCARVLAHEPARRRRHLVSLRLIFPFIGKVTRHDAAVSIRAGFRGDELARLLGLETPCWQASHSDHLLGAHRLDARRHGTPPAPA